MIEKVAIAGLDSAGKTSIIKVLNGQKPLLLSHLATSTIERHFQDILGIKYVFWDLPGQFNFRNLYIDKKNHILDQVDSFIFVIDIQNPDRFEENIAFFDYFKALRDENCSMSWNIFFHKFDSLENPQYHRLAIRYKSYLANLMKSKLSMTNQFFTTIFSPTTIFSAISKAAYQTHKLRPQLFRLIKNFAQTWNTDELYLFSSNFVELSAVAPHMTKKLETNEQILFYLRKMNDSNCINDLDIMIGDFVLHFSKLNCTSNGKVYKLFMVWRDRKPNREGFISDIATLEQNISTLLNVC